MSWRKAFEDPSDSAFLYKHEWEQQGKAFCDWQVSDVKVFQEPAHTSVHCVGALNPTLNQHTSAISAQQEGLDN